MDHSKRRPDFPLSTPINNGVRSSAYATTVKPHFDGTETRQFPDESQLVQSKLQTSFRRDIQEKYVQKVLANLPYNVRENVSSVMNLTLSATENFQKNLELSHAEVLKLRSDLKKKSLEVEQANKCCEIYRERLRTLEENLESLKDNIDSRQKFTVRNKRVIDRLASTNRMLIDSLDALQVKQDPIRSKSADKKNRSNLLRPMSYNNESSEGKDTAEQHTLENSDVNMTAAAAGGQNDKLRESLLRVAREHYKSMKNAEILETKVEELSVKLKFTEKQNRQMQLELDELRILQNGGRPINEEKNSDMHSDLPTKKSFNSQMEERIKAILNRHAAEPMDVLLQLRRVHGHMLECPATLNINDVCNHIVSRELSRVFDAEVVCMYLLLPSKDSNNNMVLKFTPRSIKPQSVSLQGCTSLVSEILTHGNVVRVNNIAQVADFNADIDGCPGVVPKKILSVPIRDRSDDRVIGVVSFINKASGNSGNFSDFDDVFASLLAENISPYLTACELYRRVQSKATLLAALLESSTALYEAVPDPDSLAVAKSLQPSEILATLEDVTNRVLRAAKVRAFLVSDHISSCESGHLIMREPVPGMRGGVRLVPAHCGIAGRVARTREGYLIDGDAADPTANPQVDLEPSDNYLLTLPIMSLQGVVVAVLQVVPGPSSPKVHLDKEDRIRRDGNNNNIHVNASSSAGNDVITFAEAARWLCHQFTGAIQYLVLSVGRPASRPVSTPHRLAANSMTFPTQASLDRGTSPLFISNSRIETLDAAFDTMLPVGLGGRGGSMKGNKKFESAKEDNQNTSSSNNNNNNNNIQSSSSTSGKARAGLSIDTSTSPIADETSVGEAFSPILAGFETDATEVSRLKEDVESLRDQLTSVGDECSRWKADAMAAEATCQEQRKIAEQLRHEMEALRKEMEAKMSAMAAMQESQNAGINNQLGELATLRQQNEQLSKQSNEQSAKVAELSNQLHASEEALAKKEGLVKILQDQLVKMAGDSLTQIDAAIKKVGSSSVGSHGSHDSHHVGHVGHVGHGPKGSPPGSAPSNQHHQQPAHNFNDTDLWEQHVDAVGQVYYHNKVTGESAWQMNENMYNNGLSQDSFAAGSSSSGGVVRHGDWLQNFDENGNEYWVNELTGESAWEIPAGELGSGSMASASHTTGGYTIEL